MNRRILASLAAAACVVLVILALSCRGGDDAHTVNFPSPAASDGESGAYGGDHAEITPDTLRTVLGRISRAESFSRTYTITNFWDGGERATALSCWQSGKNIRLSADDGYVTKNILILGEKLYVWYGDAGGYTSTLPESAAAAEADRFSGLISYEELMLISRDNILDARYEEYAGQACIFAAYRSGALGYVYRLRISIETGLLVSAEKYDGDRLVFSLSGPPPDLTTPPDSFFEIPAWYAESSR